MAGLQPNESNTTLKIEMHIMEGNLDALNQKLSVLEASSSSNFLLSEQVWRTDENTILHIAVCAGHREIINNLIEREPELLLRPNDKGDLPIHVALKAGQKDAVRTLLVDNKLAGDTRIAQLHRKNRDGNTALHLALEKYYGDLSKLLFETCRGTYYQLNEKGICPLYLAIKAGFFFLAMQMLDDEECDFDKVEASLKSRKSVIHAAILANNQDILKRLINKYAELQCALDEKGRTILSYAADIGSVNVVEYLLQNHPELAYQQDDDDDGSYPIHKACSGGNIQVFKQFYTRFSNMEHLLNKKNQNILHYAAKSGQDEIVKYLLGQPGNAITELINMKDDDGNTPLHLGTMAKHPNVVYRLTRDERVNIRLQNEQRLTALDLAEESYGEQAPCLKERLTWTALLYANVPRSTEIGECQIAPNDTVLDIYTIPISMGENLSKAKVMKYKNRLNSLLMVSILVVTITFAATFIIPGGHNSTKDHQEMVTLAHKPAFQVFVLSDTIAMYSSMFSAVSLIWAQLNETKLLLLSLSMALISLGIALTMLSVAVMASLFVVLHVVNNWLSIVVLVIGGVLMAANLVFFIPLYSPTTPLRNKFQRCVFTIYFRLMLIMLKIGS